jgi:hypothetical protein
MRGYPKVFVESQVPCIQATTTTTSSHLKIPAAAAAKNTQLQRPKEKTAFLPGNREALRVVADELATGVSELLDQMFVSKSDQTTVISTKCPFFA